MIDNRIVLGMRILLPYKNIKDIYYVRYYYNDPDKSMPYWGYIYFLNDVYRVVLNYTYSIELPMSFNTKEDAMAAYDKYLIEAGNMLLNDEDDIKNIDKYLLLL